MTESRTELDIRPYDLFVPCPDCATDNRETPPIGVGNESLDLPTKERCRTCDGLGQVLTPSGRAIRDLFLKLNTDRPIR